MKSRQSNASKRHWFSILLCSLILGLLIAPIGYVAIGALRQFPAWFQLSSLPLVVFGITALCFRYIGKWSWPQKRILQIVIDIVCWGVVVTFLYIISLFTLMTQAERLAFFLLMHLITSVIALCFLFVIKTPLEVKLEGVPQSFKAPVVLAVGAVLVVGSIWLMVTPASFI